MLELRWVREPPSPCPDPGDKAVVGQWNHNGGWQGPGTLVALQIHGSSTSWWLSPQKLLQLGASGGSGPAWSLGLTGRRWSSWLGEMDRVSPTLLGCWCLPQITTASPSCEFGLRATPQPKPCLRPGLPTLPHGQQSSARPERQSLAVLIPISQPGKPRPGPVEVLPSRPGCVSSPQWLPPGQALSWGQLHAPSWWGG